ALGELIEERLVSRVEAIERCKLQHTLDLSLKDHGQDDDAPGRALAQTGGDADVFRRSAGDVDLLLFQGALANQALAQAERSANVLPAVGVARQQRQLGRLLTRIEHVEHRLLRAYDRGKLGEDQPANRIQIFLALKHTAELG